MIYLYAKNDSKLTIRDLFSSKEKSSSIPPVKKNEELKNNTKEEMRSRSKK